MTDVNPRLSKKLVIPRTVILAHETSILHLQTSIFRLNWIVYNFFTGEVYSVKWSPKGDSLAKIAYCRKAHLLDFGTGKIIYEEETPYKGIRFTYLALMSRYLEFPLAVCLL